jgi:hypothetical protein
MDRWRHTNASFDFITALRSKEHIFETVLLDDVIKKDEYEIQKIHHSNCSLESEKFVERMLDISSEWEQAMKRHRGQPLPLEKKLHGSLANYYTEGNADGEQRRNKATNDDKIRPPTQQQQFFNKYSF